MKKGILLFYPQPASFIKKDITILSAVYTVRTHDFQAGNKYMTPVRLLFQLFFLMRYMSQTDVMVCEFAAYHSFLPALLGQIFGKPCIVIVGGNDCHNFPALRYGNYTKTLLGLFTKWSLSLCSHIAPKHGTLIDTPYSYDSGSPQRQGVRSVLPDLDTPFTVIENGYDPSKWYCDTPKQPKTFLTVCGGLQFSFQYQLKGIDLFVAAARAMPDGRFTIVGVPEGYVIVDAPDNLTLITNTPNDKLRELYSTQQFYLQLSMAEGFPNSLCEAMLCECVPVGSAVFSIPEIIGDSGFVLYKRDADQLNEIITEALVSDLPKMGKMARSNISEHYTEQDRKRKLLRLIETLSH